MNHLILRVAAINDQVCQSQCFMTFDLAPDLYFQALAVNGREILAYVGFKDVAALLCKAGKPFQCGVGSLSCAAGL